MDAPLSLRKMEEMAKHVPSCSCDECVRMCERPCWPTPDEAQRLIDAGYGNKLMLDYWAASANVYLLCPAERGREGGNASFIPRNGCTLLKNGRCTIHNVCKPLEGRVASHDGKHDGVHQSVAALWDTDKGRSIVAAWQQL